MTVLAIVCIALYLWATWRFGARLVDAANQIHQPASQNMVAVAGIALACHALTLYDTSIAANGLQIGVSNALSLIAWVAAALAIIAVPGRPHDNLAVVVLPLAALSVLGALLFPPAPVADARPLSVGVQVHVVVSVLGYGLLGLAALQAMFVALQDRLLREKRWMAMLRALPALTAQESLLFRLIGAGFFFLSLSLATGVMYVQDLFAQHLVHKTALSVVAWSMFAFLLFARWRYGWRGRGVVRLCLAAFVVLGLGYFGAKLVLEEILGRSWSA